jgi:protein TonB
VSHALSQRRHERHPVGLLLIIGLHALLGLALLSTGLRVDVPLASHLSLAIVDAPPQQPTPPRELPGAPRAMPRPVVAPVPEVVVDRVDAVVASPVPAPPVSTEAAPAAATDPVPAPASPVVAGQALGQGVGTSTGAGRPKPRAAQVDVAAPQCQPDYPPVARLHNVGGTTRLRFTIDVAGRIVGVKVLRHSGRMTENTVLDVAAAEALSHCPTVVGIDDAGQPVGGTADVDYNWVLD